MAAFDRILSGIPGMDVVLDSIRLGDNVVWQITDIHEFTVFAKHFARQAVSDNRNLIYIRFAKHEPILSPMEGLKIFEFFPEEGFESFTVGIHDLIEKEGRDTFYVFDCLSELQAAWYTDLMMGNFFRVACPYLFDLDTVAYFPLIRGKHSQDTVAAIRDTTQLMLDVYSDDNTFYLHPLKVWKRYSDTMFMVHAAGRKNMEFHVLNNGVEISRYYELIEELTNDQSDSALDSHDRFFMLAKMKSEQGGLDKDMEDLIISSTLTKDKRLKEIIKQYFRPKDYFRLKNRMIGSGVIGGKACGMLLARLILKTELKDYRQFAESHDSYYIGSDVFYTYIVSNHCWDLRIKQCSEEGFFACAEELKDAILKGNFLPEIRERFKDLLDYYGQSPIIVRSSSFLEDGFGNAFAGKYESVFCVNQGDLDARLDAFEHAVKIVYASMLDASALEYRRQRGLENQDEQMALLVQRVSGAMYGNYFFPSAAGVGFSHSVYQWRPDMDPSAGMLRLVAGLGTRAVDRTASDYPRLVNLDSPTSTTHTTIAEKHKFSQRKYDVLDLSDNSLKEIDVDELHKYMPLWYKKMLMDRDDEAESTLRQMGRYREIWFVTCRRLLENKAFTGYMQRVLKTLEKVYCNPVDIEYTINIDENGDFLVNILQCRPLYTGKGNGSVDIPAVSGNRIYFETKGTAMGSSCEEVVDVVVYIRAKEYYQYPHNQKQRVAEAVGAINAHYKGTGKKLLLMTPGRIGTSSPELGVPVRFAQISGFRFLCEVSDLNFGHMPELSYGSHMFQDLVEAEISYAAILNNKTTMHFREDMLAGNRNLFQEIVPEYSELADMIFVAETERLHYYMDALDNHVLCAFE